MVEPDNFPTLEYEFITKPYQYPYGDRLIRISDARKFFQKLHYQMYTSMRAKKCTQNVVIEKYPEKFTKKYLNAVR